MRKFLAVMVAGAVAMLWSPSGHAADDTLTGAGTNDTLLGDDAELVTTTRVVDQIDAGKGFTCALLEGTVKCWGVGGRLGAGDMDSRGDGTGEMGANLAAVGLGSERRAKAIDLGRQHACALLDDKSVKCWGANFYGELGVGDANPRGDDLGEMGDNLPAVDFGAGRTAVAISAGGFHTCALLDDGTVKCWGYNAFGQLGQGATDSRGDGPDEMGENLPAVDLGTGRTARAVTAGDLHTCALLDDYSVKCWGANVYGQLGQGDVSSRGDGPGEMGDSLSPVDLGASDGVKVYLVVAGSDHTCAVLSDWAVKCWGYGADGRLGQGDISSRGDQLGEMGESLEVTDVAAGLSVDRVVAGAAHTCGLLGGALKCWGNNDRGQLGQGDLADRGDEAGEMGDNLVDVALGTGRKVTAAAAGFEHTCAVLDDGTARCWGANTHGELGQGDTNDRGDQPDEMGESLLAIDLIAPSGPERDSDGDGTTDAVEDAGSNGGDCARDGIMDSLQGHVICLSPEALGGNSGVFFDVLDVTGVTELDGVDLTRNRIEGSDGEETVFMQAPSVGCTLPGQSEQLLPLSSCVKDGGRWLFDLVSGVELGTNLELGDELALVVDGDVDLGELPGRTATAPSDSQSRTSEMALPVGLLRLEVLVALGQSVVDMRVRSSNGEPLDNYASVVPSADDAPAWPSVTVLTDGVVVSLVDGGAGDLDGVVNGRITHIGGPADVGSPVVTAPPPAVTTLASPLRFADTRSVGETVDGVGEKTGRLVAGGEIEVQIGGRGGVPGSARGVVMNVTAIGGGGVGFVTAHPCANPRPLASSLNYTEGVNLGNEVIAGLSASGSVCLYSSAAVDLSVDVVGYVASTSPYETVTPARILETRPGESTIDGVSQGAGTRGAGTQTVLQVGGRAGVPVDAAAVVVNVTTINPGGVGFVTVHPCVVPAPLASSLNHVGGVSRGNELVASLNTAGELCLFTSAATHLSVDVVGYVPAGTNLSSVTPARLLDTRPGESTVDGVAAGAGRLSAGGEVVLQVGGRAGVPADAVAAVVNVTAIGPGGIGFVTVHPCVSPRPLASSLNYVPGVTGGNEIIVSLDDNGRTCLFTSASSHLSVDIVGYLD